MKHNLVRQTIVETSTNLFYKNGYNSTGINEIIKEAGIAKATLYNHFPSKEDICLAYLDYMNDTFISSIKDHISKAQQGKPKVIAIIDFLRGFYKQDGFGGCWCIRTVAEIPRDNKKILAKIQNHKMELLSIIEDTVSDATNLNHQNASSVAKQLYVLYEGAVSESYLHRSDWPIISAIKSAKAII